VTQGTSYRFHVRAHNNHGWGDWSEYQVVVAASTPEAPDEPVTSIENIYVKIAWGAPASNSGQLDGYDVYVAQSDGVFVLEATYCNGFTSAEILADAYCLIPMTVLSGAGYGL
jgi:hypothetical protein